MVFACEAAKALALARASLPNNAWLRVVTEDVVISPRPAWKREARFFGESKLSSVAVPSTFFTMERRERRESPSCSEAHEEPSCVFVSHVICVSSFPRHWLGRSTQSESAMVVIFIVVVITSYSTMWKPMVFSLRDRIVSI